MASVAEKLMSAEEFAQLPEAIDGSKQELVRGVVITMPPPKGKHGACCSKIDRRVGNFVEAKRSGTVVCNDTGFITERDPDSVRGADIAYWSFESLPELPDGYIAVPPDLAIEVLSPSERPTRVLAKLQEYFASGVRMVWVVSIADRTVTVYRSADQGQVFHETATLSGEEVLPGFSCLVADLLVE